MEIPSQYIKNLYKIFFAFLVVLSLFFAVKLLAEFRSYGMMGSSNANTITLSGHGEVTAIPDIASVYFTISKDAKTVKEAQDAVAVIEKKALDVLKAKGVALKDIKTSDASFYPKYEYKQAVCPPIPMGVPSSGVESSMPSPYYCPPGKQTITGYTASESITVKIRNTKDVSVIIEGLGATGVSNLNGPNFEIDNQDALQAEARKKAIADAREKAEALAKDLGVKLGRVANFSEGGGYYPMYYAKDAVMGRGESSAPAPAPAELPKGENTISSDVTITYEIR